MKNNKLKLNLFNTLCLFLGFTLFLILMTIALPKNSEKTTNDGYTNKGISKILNVSLFTVKNHRQTIMKKFQAKNCTEAIYKAVKMDLI